MARKLEEAGGSDSDGSEESCGRIMEDSISEGKVDANIGVFEGVFLGGQPNYFPIFLWGFPIGYHIFTYTCIANQSTD